MNLPESVDDPSLLQHDPLHTHVAVLKALEGGELRSTNKNAVSRFVDAMEQDGGAAAATRRWAYLVFKDVLLDENSFEITDGGKELYKVFLEYQLLLDQGLQDGSIDRAREYLNKVFRKGISAINAVKLKDRGTNAQCPTGGRGGGGKSHSSQRAPRPRPKKVRRQAETTVQHPHAGNITMSPNIRRDSHSTMDGSTNVAPPATGARPSKLPAAAKPNKCSTSKREKKRKASSQNPPVITPSDASEDDKEPSKTHEVTVGNSIPHRPRRIAPNPCSQPHDLRGFKNQVNNQDSAHRPKTKKQYREDTGISQPQSTLTSFRSDKLVPPPNIKGRRAAECPLNARKYDETRISNVRAQLTQASSNSRRMQEPGEGFKSEHDLRANGLQEPTIQGPPVIGPPSTQESIHVEAKRRRKRTRVEFETGFMVAHDKASTDSHECLGPDIRLLRPLPKKICDGRLAPAADEDTGVSGVPYGAPSLKHADQLLRDVASNELVILREGVGLDVPDWTQDEGHDAECDDLCGHDQDEASDAQVTSVTSAPPIVILKPPVPAPPRIWAQSRQEVCESFEYFRCYHSGVYSKNDIVKGYLLGAYAARRSGHIPPRWKINYLARDRGGKSESILDPRRGPKRYQTDQDQEASDKSVRALLKTCKDRRPVALLADDKYALFPYDLSSANYTYVVLGFYWISHAWAECQSARDGSGRVVRWKFAFQWCEGQGDPWWAPQQEMTDMMSDSPKSISNSNIRLTKGSPHPANTGGDPSIQCKECQEQSSFIYKQGWMCLNPRCDVFWSINGEDPKQLDYREEFLSLLPRNFENLPNLTPTRVVETLGGVTTTYAFSKGWHCTKCGRLSCRNKWEHWECPNCQFKYVVSGRIRSPKEFWHQRPPKGFLHSQIGKDSGILASRLEPINLGTHKGFTNRLTFILPHDRGKIHLILGTPLSNGDADNIFQLYQQQASTGELKLRRYPLQNHRARGLLLTNYFSQNSGEPYKYVGGSGHTVPLREAPDCVRRALALIKERSSLALRTDIPFNEVLSAAYMERQKMAFHSDSEKGLGPIVGSLSLGSTALMHFRPHVDTENPRGKSTYALTLVLRHGDVLIMEGGGVQKYYEHTVIPMNFRIAATARCIGSA